MEEKWSNFYKIEQIPIVREAMGLQIIAFREGQEGKVLIINGERKRKTVK